MTLSSGTDLFLCFICSSGFLISLFVCSSLLVLYPFKGLTEVLHPFIKSEHLHDHYLKSSIRHILSISLMSLAVIFIFFHWGKILCLTLILRFRVRQLRYFCSCLMKKRSWGAVSPVPRNPVLQGMSVCHVSLAILSSHFCLPSSAMPLLAYCGQASAPAVLVGQSGDTLGFR